MIREKREREKERTLWEIFPVIQSFFLFDTVEVLHIIIQSSWQRN
jgi:hypothetical protein